MRIYALLFGIFCHTSFIAAIVLMFFSIYHGLQINPSQMGGFWAVLVDICLVLQFPILHSLLLHKRGSFLLDYFSPKQIAKQMRTTVFSTISAWQLIILFACWQNSGRIIYQTNGDCLYLHSIFYCSSWIYLALAIREAGAGLQTGLIGWYSVFTKRPPKYPKLPTSGLHGHCRHPIYLAFALILITAPTLSLDLLLLNVVWIPYCIFAPRLKEQRLNQFNAEIYPQYKALTPYMFPRCFIKFCPKHDQLNKII